MSNIKLESGKEYSLAELFSGDNKIVIPDLQRDYCWGDKAWDKDKKTHTELVSGFVANLIDVYKNNSEDKLTLGLIYGYEQPKYHIQLCDGQQRVTTLFLLLGMINRQTDNRFQEKLISDFELMKDDKEPYLQYAIRESTLYFLSDLVCEFFLKRDISVADIKKQDWYFAEYDLDASIVSMVEALKLIEKNLLENADLNLVDFGNFITNNLQMLYYDMGNRIRGEETFVVINTTGEPLTATENLKPILLGKLDNKEMRFANKNGDKETELEYYSHQWEEREEWFWKYRNGNQIADAGLNEFFRWVTIILNIDDKDKLKELLETDDVLLYKNLNKDEIEEYFKTVKFLFEKEEPAIFNNNLDWLSPDPKNSLITWFRLLPVIEYKKRFADTGIRDIIRVKNFFHNLSRLDNVSKNVSALLPEAIGLIKRLPDKDIASLVKLDKVSSSILTEEERLKFELYLKDEENRASLEDKFWIAESHTVLNGAIKPLLEWSKVDTVFNEARFDEYYRVFNAILHDNCQYPELDITRRALLTQNLKEYPRVFSGYRNRSFCWEYSEWMTLISDNIEAFGVFLSQLIDQEDIYIVQKRMINDFPNDGVHWFEFVKIPEILEYCEHKNIQFHGEVGWELIKKEKINGGHANLQSYHLYLDLKKTPFWDENSWKINFYDRGNTCVYFDHKGRNIAIDVFYIGTDKHLYQLEVFRRDASENTQRYLADAAKNLNLKWNEKRFESEPKNWDEIVKLLKEVINYTYS